MLQLAMRSVRQRPGRFFATLLSAFLGATVIMTFNSMLDTAGASGVDPVSEESLNSAAQVVGGYGTLLVFFAVASTLTVNVRQRDAEIGLLHSVGATPAQIKWMITGEAVVVALVGTLAAVGPAVLGGQVLLEQFKDSGQVAQDVDHVFGPVALATGISITLLASAGAAFLAVRRAAKARFGTRRRGVRVRVLAGCAALAAGASGVGATFAMEKTEPMAMAPPAYGAILLAVGLAILSPALLRLLLAVLEGPLAAFGGAGAYLAVRNVRRRAAELSGTLMPLILFVALATATLYMQAVQNDAIKESGLVRTVDDKNLETLNFVIVGIIVAFAYIMLINTLYAATAYRRREFGQERLAGATPAQVMRMIGWEGLLLTLAGVLYGSLAGLAGIVAFTRFRTGSSLPDQGLGPWLGTVAAAAAATFLTSLLTAHRALRVRAVTAAAVIA
ncbi:FtsX-like permease family protein [Streptomyces sp. enrichment culture]|uniref:ABC transporter permease n=1 Tax=Streptomyces sp. enrichment culture TaxID=1795815 RepID=UPI003F5509C5